MKNQEKKYRLKPEILKECTQNVRLRRALEDLFEFTSPTAMYALVRNKPERLTGEYAKKVICAYLGKEESEILEEITN
jgi:hypothetical protein